MKQSTFAVILTLAAICQGEEAPGGKSGQASPQSPDRSAPNIPKDARWTLFCATISGPDHVSRAKSLRNQLLSSTKMRDWYIIQAEDQTTIYYGYYRDNEMESRAAADRKAIVQLTSGETGARLFGSVFLVELESDDPPAPPEWNLLNSKGEYTLQIGVYKGSRDRKLAAVQAVREARALGQEAYFYHGPSASSVCIGAWPASAVHEQNEFKASNPNSVPLATPGNLQVPEGMTTPDGKPIEVMQAKFEITDPSLLAAMRGYPNHSINGVEGQPVRNPQTGQVRIATKPSFIVKIPHTEIATRPHASPSSTPTDSPPAISVSSTPPPARPQRPPPPIKEVPKGGKLRSLED